MHWLPFPFFKLISMDIWSEKKKRNHNQALLPMPPNYLESISYTFWYSNLNLFSLWVLFGITCQLFCILLTQLLFWTLGLVHLFFLQHSKNPFEFSSQGILCFDDLFPFLFYSCKYLADLLFLFPFHSLYRFLNYIINKTGGEMRIRFSLFISCGFFFRWQQET